MSIILIQLLLNNSGTLTPCLHTIFLRINKLSQFIRKVKSLQISLINQVLQIGNLSSNQSNMLSNKARVIFFIVAAILIIPATLLWFLGYQNSVKWNNNAIQIYGIITTSEVLDSTCSYSCNCHEQCSASGNDTSCQTVCDTCYYTCYDGRITVTYVVNNQSYTYTAIKISGNSERDAVVSQLSSIYPIGSSFKLYYNKNDPNDVSQTLKDSRGFYIGFFVVIGLISLIVLVWAASETYLFWKARRR